MEILYSDTMSSDQNKTAVNSREKTITAQEQQTKVYPSEIIRLLYCDFWMKKHLSAWWYFASSLQINEVRRLIGPLSGKSSVYCSDASIARHLRARNWNVKKATKMLQQTLKWRASNKPEEIRWVSDCLYSLFNLYFMIFPCN